MWLGLLPWLPVDALTEKKKKKKNFPSPSIQLQLEPARYRISRNSSQKFALVDDERKALPWAMLLALALELLLFSSNPFHSSLVKALIVPPSTKKPASITLLSPSALVQLRSASRLLSTKECVSDRRSVCPDSVIREAESRHPSRRSGW